jgi:hypothetical protein
MKMARIVIISFVLLTAITVGEVKPVSSATIKAADCCVLCPPFCPPG